jgi:hypothetical protein
MGKRESNQLNLKENWHHLIFCKAYLYLLSTYAVEDITLFPTSVGVF